MARKSDKRKNVTAGYAREVISLLLLALATILTLSLVSYHPLDNTLLSTNSESDTTRNYIGPVGANIAIILIQLFGYSSYLIPIALFTVGGSMIVRIPINAWITKLIGFVGLMAGTTVAISYAVPYLTAEGVEHPFPGGGISGRLLIESMTPALSDLAILIISFATIAVSLLLAIHFSFGKLFRGILTGTHSAAENLKQRRRAAKVRKKKPGSPRVVVKLVGWPFRRKRMEEGIPPLPQLQHDEDVEGFPPHGRSRKTSASDENEFRPKISVPRGRRKLRPGNLVGMIAPISLLDDPPASKMPLNLKMLAEQARAIVNRYREFGIEGEVLQTNPGPVVHTFEFKPAPGIKYSKVVGLADELCMALKAISIRINRIAGKSTIGLEVPNDAREIICMRELIESPEYQNIDNPLALSLGKTIVGDPYIARLDEMPHLLIAGATGTGKSVALNSMICSILFKSPPDTTKFILIDPKQVELSLYEGIPHLLTPVVTSPKRAAAALRWACEEMEVRYQKLAEQGVRNIDQYNSLVSDVGDDVAASDESEPLEPMPYIVIAIDELADLMMVSSADVEESICRLAQKARAVGIHLIIATQRPSVDVLTGVIKANFQCRISFRVATKVDSRTVLDSNGAEDLLGNGDMLYLPPRSSRLIRLHGPLINEKEVARVVDYFRRMDKPEYDQDIISMSEHDVASARSLAPDKDPLYEEAVNLVLSTGVASISNLQRKMRLGYARAARIIDMMEEDGIVGPADGSKPRQILKKQMM